MTPGRFRLVSQVGRVPSMTVPLDAQQEIRFQRLMEESVMIDLHQHPMVIPEDFSQYWEYLRSDNYVWGYDAVRAGGFTAVGTANVFRGMLHTNEMSFIRFSDLLEEVGMMISDIGRNDDVLQVSNAGEIESAKQQDKVGFLPTVEHLAIGNELNRVDVLYNAGIRLAGLTYSRKAYIGDGIFERNDGGLSDFGLEVVRRMNELGMVVDVSHASSRTAMDAIEASEAPVTFSHDGSFTLASHSFQARRLRKDEELLACARKGGIIGVTAVPNRLSNDPEQSIECVLDHYDYMVNLVGVGKGGLWSLLARALAPQLHRTLVDVSNFSSGEDRAYLEQLYVPVLRRAGDFKTAAMLAPASRLLIHNTGENFNTDWFRQAYKLAGKTDLLETESDEIPRERLLSWLTQSGP